MYYNSKKGGVDTMNQLIRTYSTKQMTHHWPMAIFYNMMVLENHQSKSYIFCRNRTRSHSGL